MEVTRTFDLLERYRAQFNIPNALVSKKKGKWIEISSEEYIRKSHLLAYGLMAMGIEKGDKVANVAANCPEWNIVDMGMAMAGIVHVPIFTNLCDTEYQFIFEHAEAKLVFVSDKNLFANTAMAAESTGIKDKVYSFNKVEGAIDWENLLELGEKNEAKFKEKLEAVKAEIKPEDFATLIYTSGTTGASKGVMLSHKNMVQNFLAATKIFLLKPGEKYLSILPLCHVGGRLGNYQTQYSGTSIYYAESMGTIAKNMKELQPTGFDAVPRILEKIFDNILAKGKDLKGMKKTMFFWAVKLGLNYRMTGFGLPFYNIKLKIADKLIFSKWREAIGGKARLVGCGGASLQPRLERVFWAAGVKILNMYGLTETSPIITINCQTKPGVKLGSVGKVIPGVEVKIAKDGEILCKGHCVMLGYYKDPELTATVFDDEGWFHTGDIGHLDKNGFLHVTDRKKEIFKLSNGKFIAPQPIENRLKESILIDHVMVVGEHQKFASALISPNFTYIDDWCKAQGIEIKNKSELICLPEVQDKVGDEVKQINKTLNGPEKILRFRLVADEWQPATGELSPTLKLKRNNITAKYQEVINTIYIKQTV